MKKSDKIWLLTISGLLIVISYFHYTTPTTKWPLHLIFMESYFVPILIGAFQFGVKGGLGTAVAVSLIYFPHIMLQWGGLVETNLMRFLQIGLFNIIGYLTGVKAAAEKKERLRYQKAAEKLEHSFRKLQEQSEKISEMESQLRTADRLAVIGELTANLAHEVRNPLGSILGVAEILEDELPASSKLHEFSRILLEETKRLNEVVENYLNLSRAPKNRPKDFILTELLKGLTQILSFQARRADIKITTEVSPPGLILRANEAALRQVLLNLMLNGIQASEPGGSLRVKAKSQSVVRNSADGTNRASNSEMIDIRVQDDGAGIEEKTVELIFKPFYTTKQNGTGLGLAIVKRIADENKWHIAVHRIEPKGTEFELLIPIGNTPKNVKTQNR